MSQPHRDLAAGGAAPMSTEAEIARRFGHGATAREIIGAGFATSTVYKVRRRIGREPNPGNSLRAIRRDATEAAAALRRIADHLDYLADPAVSAFLQAGDG